MTIEKSLDAVEATALRGAAALQMEEGTPVREVLRGMRDHACCTAVLTRQGRLSGLFTESDMLQKVLGKEGALERPVADFMTRDPERVRDTDPVRRVVHEMRRTGHRTLPVVDASERVVACIRHRDVVRYLAQHFAPQILNLPPDPGQTHRAPEGA